LTKICKKDGWKYLNQANEAQEREENAELVKMGLRNNKMDKPGGKKEDPRRDA